MIALQASSQDTDFNPRQLRDSLDRQPSFTIFGDNYFITGTSVGDIPTVNNSDGKLQLGFKQLLTRQILPGETFLFFTYRQLSFWNIYQNSFPFKDNNYNPAFGLGKIIIKNNQIDGGLWLSVEHESNGLNDENSRAWNFVSLLYSTKLNEKSYFAMKGWIPITPMVDNPDLPKYKSLLESKIAYLASERWLFQAELRKSFTFDWRGRIQLDMSYRLSKSINNYLYLQYFNGYGESLIDYTKHTHMLRVGIAFKDLGFLNNYNRKP